MAAAQPARLGAGVWEGWDPRDEIFSDRREDDDKLPGPDGKPVGKHKDGRLLVLRVDDMAEVTQTGATVGSVKAPTQIYFVPGSAVKNRFASSAHEFRDDLTSIAAGTKVYDVYATSMEIKTSIFPSLNTQYQNQRRASAVKVGELVLSSPFIASQFGDSGVFFKHQRFEDR